MLTSFKAGLQQGGAMNNTAIVPRLLNVRQAAKYLAVCERTLWNLTQEGRVPAIKIGRCVRYDLTDLDAFIAEAKGAEHIKPKEAACAG